MRRTITELQYLLNILYDIYHHFPRNYGSNHENYFTYNLPLFMHELRGKPIIDKLIDVDFDSTISDERKQTVYYSEEFADGKCAIIDEHHVSFHYSMSETLFCYTAYLLRNDLNTILNRFQSDAIRQQFIGTRIEEEERFVYPYMIHQNIWETIREVLEYPNLTYNFIFNIANYAGAKSMLSMEVQLNKIDSLLNTHINGYNFDSFNENLILAEE